MKNFRYLAVVLVIALTASFSFAVTAEQPEDLPPMLLDRVAALFPGVKGPFSLKYKSETVIGDLDIHIGNYEFIAGGKDAGPLTRITSLDQQRTTGNLDVFVRYDEKGAVRGIANIIGLDESSGTNLLSMFYRDKDPRQYKDAMTVLINGLSAGAISADASVKPEPPKTYALEVKQKMLAPGDKLPGLKAKDLEGKEFNTSLYKDRPLVMVFASADNLRCDDMIRAVDTGLRGNGRTAVAYIISSDAGITRAYMERLDVKGTIVSEPADYAAKMFQVPYKPYVFMFDRGVLKYALPWNGEGDLAGYLRNFTGGKK